MASKILIVEDEADIAELIRYNVERAGYQVRVLGDGRQALQLIPREPPDLVILDLMLPGMDGLELCRRLRAEAATRALPMAIRTRVLAVSGLVLAGVLALGYVLARHLTRPIHEMVRQSQAIAGEDLSQRTSLPTNDELADLSRSLNRMADALEESLHRLEAERDRVKTMLESMAEGMIRIDPDGRIGVINAAGADMLGVPADRAVGQRPLEMLRSFELGELIERARKDRRAAAEIVLRHPTYRVVEATAVTLTEHARTEGILLVLRDVTTLRRLEAVRLEFVANVSHELRTPLTAIRGFVETLLDGALDSPVEARRFLGTVARHAERLSRLLDDLLDLSNIELGRVALCLEPVSLREVVQHAVGGLEPVAAK